MKLRLPANASQGASSSDSTHPAPCAVDPNRERTQAQRAIPSGHVRGHNQLVPDDAGQVSLYAMCDDEAGVVSAWASVLLVLIAYRSIPGIT